MFSTLLFKKKLPLFLLGCSLPWLALAQQRPMMPPPPQTLPTIVAEATERGRYFDWLPLKPKPDDDGPDGWLLGTGTDIPSEVVASSTLAGQGKSNYGAANLTDDDPTTAWVEGKADHGIGESLTMNLPFGIPVWRIVNGYQKNATTWEDNSRVKKLKVLVNGRPAFYILLEDKMGPQEIKIREVLNKINMNEEGMLRVKFIIEEVYPGRKYKDTAISAIYYTGC
jgi:hypothetical protein